MATMTILLGGLLACVAVRDDPDPEPPRPGPIVVKLVAKKSTYKLDLQGHQNAEQYAKEAAAGRVSPIEIDAEMEITNTSKNDILVRVAGSSPRMAVILKGPGVVTGRTRRKPDFKGGTKSVVLKPGEKTSIPVRKMTDAVIVRGKTYYWTTPGEYTLSATFTTAVTLNYNQGKVSAPSASMKLTAGPITIKVEK